MDQKHFFTASFDIYETITWDCVDGRLAWALMDEAWSMFCQKYAELVDKHRNRWYGTIEVDGPDFVVCLFEEE